MQLERSYADRRNLLLAALPAGDFALLAPHLKPVTLVQGTVLQEQGDAIDEVYFPHDGIISLLAVMRQGEAIELATIGLEGAVGSLSGDGRAPLAYARGCAGSGRWECVFRRNASARLLKRARRSAKASSVTARCS